MPWREEEYSYVCSECGYPADGRYTTCDPEPDFCPNCIELERNLFKRDAERYRKIRTAAFNGGYLETAFFDLRIPEGRDTVIEDFDAGVDALPDWKWEGK